MERRSKVLETEVKAILAIQKQRPYVMN
jgi:hypothetical protein